VRFAFRWREGRMETPAALVKALEDILHDALSARDFGREAYVGTFESLLVAHDGGGLEVFRVFRSRGAVRSELETAIPAGEWLAAPWWPVVQQNLHAIGQQWWAEAEAAALRRAVRPGCRRAPARI
jgi:hypothetical protein